MLGMTAENVRAWRNRRKIKATWRTAGATADPAPPEGKKTGKAKKAARATAVRLSAIDNYDHLLGVIPDATLAHFTGLKLATVGKARAKRGIPAPDKVDGPPPRHRRSKMDPYLHLLGKASDSEVANLAGVSSKNVSNFRRRHGIPSARTLSAARASEPEVPAVVEAEVEVEAPVPAAAEVVAAPPVVVPDGVQWAFKATVERAGVDRTYVVFGPDLALAAALATSRIGEGDRLTMMESVATVL
jgi:hypothetical protein